MSSTTDSARGQALAIFAISLTALLGAAALAFDAGLVYVERRDEQNAADAAALAGAHYLPDQPSQAKAAAFSIAAANGYTPGGNTSVVVTTPFLWSGKAANEPSAGFVEVEISNTRPSFFAAVLGVLNWPVSARAVAANEDDVVVAFSILALNETACPGLEVSGTGKIEAAGDIQVDSNCENGPGALKLVSEGAGITVTVDGKKGACSVHGAIKGDVSDGCEPIEGAMQAGDPFETFPAAPALPQPTPLDMEQLIGDLDTPAGCPGSDSPATSAEPDMCQFSASYKDTAWLVHPGIYPGGLKLNSGTFYLMPGLYYIEGGGVNLGGGDAAVTSVESDGVTPGGGVLFYNTESDVSDGGPVVLNGGNSDFDLEPFEGVPWDGFVIFQDRTLDIQGDDITINGSDSDMSVRGLIYAKLGSVKVNGAGGTIIVDQIIADTFSIRGGGGTIEARRANEFLPTLTIAGLVE